MPSSPISADELERTRQFWNASPCDGHTHLDARRQWRYAKDPWLPTVIQEIARQHSDVVEIGCGQGTDGLAFCSYLESGKRYRGFDYSDESLESARIAATEATNLRVEPVFAKGNAEKLDLPDNSVECIYSMGVLHHTPDTDASVREVLRVLQPGGRAHILLYNRASPKVLAAHVLRGIQRGLDVVLRTDRCLYRLLYGRHGEGVLGTALLEGFGVPVLRSYTKAGMFDLFRGFKVLSLVSCGINLPTGMAGAQSAALVSLPAGLFWYIVAEKPG